MYQYRTHTSTGPGNIKQIVFAIMYKQLRSFGFKHIWFRWRTCIFDKYLIDASLFNSCQILIQFNDLKSATTCNQIGTTLVENQRTIMVSRFKFTFFPFSFFNVFGSENIGFVGSLRICCNIIHPIVIPDTACPRSFSIITLSVDQTQFIHFA